jgi:hypothetical protein
MSAEEQTDLKRLFQKMEEIGDKVESIDRGLYGDAKNKVAGLMQKQFEVEDRVKVLEDKDKKRMWMVAGFSSAAGLGIPSLLDWIKKLGS